MENRNVAALILAAGQGSRMGRVKALLEYGGEAALARCARIFRENGLDDVRAVLGYEAGAVAPLAGDLGLPVVVNPRPEEGMFSSVRAGVENLAGKRAPEAFFVLPVDIPLVRPRTAARLLKAWEADPDPLRVIRPAFLGEPGHPPLIGAGRIREILNWTGQGGLRGCLEAGQGRIEDLPVADEGVLLDADTPADHERLAARARPRGAADAPSVRECLALFGLERISEETQAVRAHSREVASAALRLARGLTLAGLPLDMELVLAGALLHDVRKGWPDHAGVGAQFLRREGFPALAELVAVHPGRGLPEPDPSGRDLDEAHVVYLADKYVRGEERVTLDARFEEKIARFANDPDARAGALRRVSQAEAVRRAVKARAGTSPEELLDIPWPEAEARLEDFSA